MGNITSGELIRVLIACLAVVIGGILAHSKVISGDTWIALVCGILLPSPLEAGRRFGGGGGGGSTAIPAAMLTLYLLSQQAPYIHAEIGT